MKKNDIIAVINKILDNCYTKLTDDEQNVIHDIIEAVDENGTLNRIIQRQDKELSRLTAENAELCATLSKMETVEARLEKAVELPPGDRVWYIAEDEEGAESYIISKPTSSLAVEELKYEIGKKYFTTREAAEKRLAELNGGKQ